MMLVNAPFLRATSLVAASLLTVGHARAAEEPATHVAALRPASETPDARADVKAYLKAFYARPQPQFTREVLEQVHKLPPAALAAASQLDLPVGAVHLRDVSMPGAAKGEKIALRLFDVRAQRARAQWSYSYHGGGYVLGSIDSHAGLAAEISRQLDLPVVSVEYRLAPEHPWPAAPDDGEAAARWIAANGKAFGRTFTGLVLSGDSAGGNLTLITAAALRDRPAALPVILQMPIYPATDFAGVYPSSKAFADGYLLDAKTMASFSAHYAADPASLRASPILGDLAGLPPTVLVTASLDPLRDQGRAYAAKLIEAGVPTAYYEGRGLIHSFATLRKAIPSAQADTAAFLTIARTMLNGQTVTAAGG